MADKIPNGIRRDDILQALIDLDGGEHHNFGESTGYDLVHEGKRYPPKAVIGLAARKVAGNILRPSDFHGGLNTKCFRILKEAGFDIIAKRKELTSRVKIKNKLYVTYNRQRNMYYGESKSSSPPADAYVRYMRSYETVVAPRHDKLQTRFERYLSESGASEIQSNVGNVDLRFKHPTKGLVFAEIKPCDRTNARYAIRTAIGQLLDYRQRTPDFVFMLIVLEVRPNHLNQALAVNNGFGIGFPTKSKFKLVWPEPAL